MAIRTMSPEKTDNLIEIHVEGQGCVEGIFTCSGRFDTTHNYSCGFKPDKGWYRIADYTITELKQFHKRNITITYADTCADIKTAVEQGE